MTIELALIGVERSMARREQDWISLPWGAMGRWVDRYLLPWGMVHEEGRDGRPSFPDYADFGTTQEEVEVYTYPDKDNSPGEPPKNVADFIAAEERVMAYAPEVPGIPAWKLGSNDNWIITPVEAAGALHKWQQAGSPVPEGRDGAEWLEFIDLLRTAAQNQGLIVS